MSIQSLSHSVSDAIRTYVTTEELKSPTATYTILHTSLMYLVNRMFDSTNDKNSYDLNSNKNLMYDCKPQMLQNLKNTNKLFNGATKICHKTKKLVFLLVL